MISTKGDKNRVTDDKASRSSVRAARRLPADLQDDIARVVLRLAGADDESPVLLTSEEQAAVAASRSAAAIGEFASDDEIRAVWAKHGL